MSSRTQQKWRDPNALAKKKYADDCSATLGEAICLLPSKLSWCTALGFLPVHFDVTDLKFSVLPGKFN